MAIGTSDTVAAHGNHRASIDIDAPPALGYALWSQFDRFPDYLRHVTQVQVDPQRPGLQHWQGKVHGVTVDWDAEVTAMTPNQLIAWRSVKGFENSGSVAFEARGEEGMTLTVQLGYNPPLGPLGDVAEALWYKQRFDEGLEEDLTRFKSLCEGLFGRYKARLAAGEAADAAMQRVLSEDAGIVREALPRRIEPDDYHMSHVPMPNPITTIELGNRLAWGEPAFTILDVRPLEYFKEAHIQGANAAPLEVLEERVKEITDRMQHGLDRQLVVYSNRGDGLSAQAARRLIELGYARVFDYVDGFEAWRSSNGPVEFQTVGQIASKGLPERPEYVERVMTAPTANDHGHDPNAQPQGAAQEKVSPKAYGVPGAHLEDTRTESTEEFLRREELHEQATRELDPRANPEAGHRQST